MSISERELEAELEAAEKEVKRLGAELIKVKKDLAYYKAYYEKTNKPATDFSDILGRGGPWYR